jgi:hypothetical protein
METSLLTLVVSRKRDVVRAVRCARQVSRLLGLEPREQAGLACGVFELTCRAAARFGRVQVKFGLAQGALRVAFHRFVRARPDCPAGLPLGPALQVTLPDALPVAREDLIWVIRELDPSGPVNCFEEMRRQTRELLQALVELRRAESRTGRADDKPGLPAAA